MPWHFYALEFGSGFFRTNGVLHFVQGISGNRFQSPFASPPGGGESSPRSNALWGIGNFVAGFVFLWFFGRQDLVEWIAVGLSILLASVWLWKCGRPLID
jgi:hypothetical protein